MAVSEAVQRGMRGKARILEAFGCEADANDRMAFLRAEGRTGVRKSRFLDFTRSDGRKVYGWRVSADA